MMTLLIVTMLLIVLILAFYAGALLYKVRLQKAKKEATRQQRAKNVIESITTIALAMQQQQCNVSEGCIRLYHLLEAVPLINRPDFSQMCPAIYAMYHEVKDYASHDARKQLSNLELKRQDAQREEKEEHFEHQVLQDLIKIKDFFAVKP